MNSKLWYKHPAKSFSEALPFGNGSLGGMAYGGVPNERITLNLDTLWSGTGTKSEKKLPDNLLAKARKLIFNNEFNKAEELIKNEMLGFYNESYMPMGILDYEYININEPYNYKRELDISNGIVSSSFSVAGEEFNSTLFSTYVDKSIIINFEAKSSKALNMRFSLSSLLKSESTSSNNGVVLTGNAPSHVEPNYIECSESIFYNKDNMGMIFEISLDVHSTDGVVSIINNNLTINNASKIVLILTASNGYKGYKKALSYNREEIHDENYKIISTLRLKSYNEILESHIDDFRNLMGRVNFVLEDKDYSYLPTDIRLNRLKDGKTDLNFYALYFQFARYLMISSSRTGSEPSNLQGIWSDELRPPWSSNYTTNINIQMNYWLVCGANLKECHEPLDRLIKELSDRGKETAKKQYNCNGWAVNHNVCLWRQSNPVSGLPKFAYWPMGGVWLAAHLMEYYSYTMDLNYLKTVAYPLIEGCVEFCLDWLVEGPDGNLHTCPSTSPENVFYDEYNNICSVSYSSTMDISLIYELFTNYKKISEIIDVNPEMLLKVKHSIERLPKIKVGKDGAIQEWILPFNEVEVGHRHLSPIYGFHPGNFINTNNNKELLEACRKFVQKRVNNGGGQVGWSCAWLINIFSRLKDINMAYKYVQDLITTSSYNNLLDIHPPLGENFEGEKEVYMIDGNFGGANGIMSLLMQSHLGYIEPLPCLPQQWEAGQIEGLVAHGGFEVSIWWKKNSLVKCIIKSLCGEVLRIKYQFDLVVILNNKEITTQKMDNKVIEFGTEPNQIYTITVK